MNRCIEYFEELINRPATNDSSDIQPAKVYTNCEKPSKEEIRMPIKLLKDGKAAGIPSRSY